jgi:ankyrin repeat protein
LQYVGGHEYTTPLAAAAYVGSAEIIQLLLEYGADPDFTTRDNETPLIIGIREGRAEAVRALLEGGADPDADDAILIAAQRGEEEMVRDLLEMGADPDLPTMSPLLAAVAGGHMGIAAALVEAGADVAARNARGRTVMNRARSNANRRTLRNLLARKSGQLFTNLQAANNRLPPNVAAHVTEYLTGTPKKNNPAYRAQFRTRRGRRGRRSRRSSSRRS